MLNNKDSNIAIGMYLVFQKAYTVEANIIGVKDFPPLERNVDRIMSSDNDFYGYCQNEEYAGIIEIVNNSNQIYIDSLVVHPKYFRKGIGQQLVQHIIDLNNTAVITVETAVANLPAIKLYQKMNFKEIGKWTTSESIDKVKFELKNNFMNLV